MSEENINISSEVLNKSKKITKIVTILLVVAALLSVFFFIQYRSSLKDPDALNREKIESLVVKVEKLIDLPQGELPTLAEITSIENLKDQPFFAKAKVGDQVLLYTVARKAYLYDPVANVIVEVASVNLGN
ncbi:MAG: hypothetical protein QG585_8 [Patescibacteria group bacterium]|jgi:hypothetical protein|nr:hypothetical protein [Patescibacteria group bacterium]